MPPGEAATPAGTRRYARVERRTRRLTVTAVAAVCLLAVSSLAGAVNDTIDDRRRHEARVQERCVDHADLAVRRIEAQITVQVALGLTAIAEDDDVRRDVHIAAIRQLSADLTEAERVMAEAIDQCGEAAP